MKKSQWVIKARIKSRTSASMANNSRYWDRTVCTIWRSTQSQCRVACCHRVFEYEIDLQKFESIVLSWVQLTEVSLLQRRKVLRKVSCASLPLHSVSHTAQYLKEEYKGNSNAALVPCHPWRRQDLRCDWDDYRTIWDAPLVRSAPVASCKVHAFKSCNASIRLIPTVRLQRYS